MHVEDGSERRPETAAKMLYRRTRRIVGDTELLEESEHMEAVCACCASGGWTGRDVLAWRSRKVVVRANCESRIIQLGVHEAQVRLSVNFPCKSSSRHHVISARG